ncbi:hypothetical protein [Teredinibacter sp. KSP-S5-2]|uniref:hypothetical protein n=1 Tax=Teredinibacter sp. KSP-S5-2 TaxID=3034506 RepID=UPI002934B16A|nr:hypothetical protein [Teredinibacter sp. KSP-S5-2]WNO09333.1 hypothetical protein P5V12_20525 [Teredinibacter sp. KSP-S5-2]
MNRKQLSKALCYLFFYPMYHVFVIFSITLLLTPALEWTFHQGKSFLLVNSMIIVTLWYVVHLDELIYIFRKKES